MATVATPMKKLLNDPANIVKESLAGLAAAHGDLVRYDAEAQILVRATPADKVALISGGGSGHEPMHGGFVGPGMLDAACPGEVFTSPTPDQMLEATKAVDGGAGVLHIVKNYTGDVLNFKLAAEYAERGIPVSPCCRLDVAVPDSLYPRVAGGGATVLAEKMQARGERGETCRGAGSHEVNEKTVVRRSLSSFTPPALARHLTTRGEMEVCIGIHGEPGRERGPWEPYRSRSSFSRR